MSAERLRVGALISRVARLLRRNPLPISLAMVIPAAVGVAIDCGGEQDPRIQVFVSLAITFAQFVMISSVLRREGQHHAWAKAGRAASFIGQGLVTGIAIAIGICLAVLPGLFLYARWIAVVPLVVGEGCTMGEAMRLSWRRTAPGTLGIMLCVAICWAMLGGSAVVMGLYYPEYGAVGIAPAIAANLLLTAALVSSWLFAVAVHLQIRSDAPA